MRQTGPEREIKPATSVVLVRETPQLEVFMVVRHHQIKFAGGALVFPGGKVDRFDRDPELRQLCTGQEGIDDEELAIRIAALRELFEESGILLARDSSGEVISEHRLEPLQKFRCDLDAGRLPVKDFLKQNDLRLAADLLTPYARWIAPDWAPRRFDTHFFIARAPSGQSASHDGTEAVDSAWLNPCRVVQEADEGKWAIMLPTRMNLLRLANATTAGAAIAAARAQTIVPITPTVILKESKKYFRIPEGAGYETTETPVDSVLVP